MPELQPRNAASIAVPSRVEAPPCVAGSAREGHGQQGRRQTAQPQKAAQLLQQLKDIVEELKQYGITLTTDDRKRTLRPRRGAEAHMRRVHDLAVKHGVS